MSDETPQIWVTWIGNHPYVRWTNIPFEIKPKRAFALITTAVLESAAHRPKTKGPRLMETRVKELNLFDDVKVRVNIQHANIIT